MPSTPKNRVDGEPLFVDADPIVVENMDADHIRKSAVYNDSFYNEGSFHSQPRAEGSLLYNRQSDFGQNLMVDR